MKHLIYTLCACSFGLFTYAKSPKIVVGIVIDQMRWDNLYRYADQYKPTGGFARLLTGGFACHNVLIPYIPTYTACGHACIYTGSTPAYHGIVGNHWIHFADKKKHSAVYDSIWGQSPRNMQSTTIGDQLRLATAFRARVYSISLKDRAAILPGGQNPNGVFWWDETRGGWKHSSYYGAVPQWVQNQNVHERQRVDQYYREGWRTLYPLHTYTQSSPDNQPFETGLVNTEQTSFPYDTRAFVGKNYKTILFMPQGIDLTFGFAEQLIQREQIGNNPAQVPDFIAISISPTDYIGHSYGPNSVETQDVYLRLDSVLGAFLHKLENQFSKENILVFLTADHGVSPIPRYLRDNHIAAEAINFRSFARTLDSFLARRYNNQGGLIRNIVNNQIYLHHEHIAQAGLSAEEVSNTLILYLNGRAEVLRAYSLRNPSSWVGLPPLLRQKTADAFHVRRSGDIQMIFQPFTIEGWFPEETPNARGTTHGAWNSYDAHIPLIFYGNQIPAGESFQLYHMTDIAPTICAALRIDFPSANIGNPITECFTTKTR